MADTRRTSPQRPFTILIIDDDRPMLETARELLAGDGHQVLTASSGEDGLTTVRTIRADMILVDYHMPVMNGLEVVRRLKADATTRGVPVVALTSGTAEDANELPTRWMTNRLKVEVEDTGEGIEASAADRIFSPFHTTRAGGTGLGLALAHGIIEDHGGVISFESTPRQDTTFTIILSLVAEPPNPAGSD